jgi:hypothetical protein
MWSTSVSIVGRAVIADVASSAENNGTAMNKVADLFVSLGRRGNMWPHQTCIARNVTQNLYASRGIARGPTIRLAQVRSCRARVNESSSLVSARKS